MIERIAVDPKVHFGKPCVAGTRITVQSVLELLDEGLSFEEIIRDYYPDLACFCQAKKYPFDNRKMTHLSRIV